MASTYAPCSQCGKLNRVDLSQSGSKEPICGSCKATLPIHFGVVEVSGASLKKLVEKSPIPVVCDFWASWCGPCKVFAPVFQQAALELSGKLVFAKLNTEQHALASDAYKIRSIPTLIFFQHGLERDRLSGALPLQEFKHWLETRQK